MTPKQYTVSPTIIKSYLQWGDDNPNIVPVSSATKRPATLMHGISWKQYQTAPITPKQYRELFKPSDPSDAIGLFNGVNGWRHFDFDKVISDDCVFAVLDALGLPEDYPWAVLTGSGSNHIIFRCAALPDNHNLPGKKSEQGVFMADGIGFDHLELRWERCMTILPFSMHKSGNLYQFMHSYTTPVDLPAMVDGQKVVDAFDLVTQRPAVQVPVAKPTPKPKANGTGNENFEELKSRLNIEDIAAAVGWEYTQKGGEYVGKCPLHESQSGTCLSFGIDDALYNCFHAGCDAGGDIIAFIGLWKNLPPIEAARWAAATWAADLSPKFAETQPTQRPPHPAGVDSTKARKNAGKPATPEATTEEQGPGAEALMYEPHTTLEVNKDGLACLKYYELTEAGTRQRFIDQFGAKLRYNHTAEKFMIFDGQRWTQDDTALTSELVCRLITQLEIDAQRAEKLLTQHYEKEAGTPYTAEKQRKGKEARRLKSQEKTKALLEQIDPLVNYARAVKGYCFNAKKNLKNTVNHITALSTHHQNIATTEESFDKDPYLLNVKNGTLNLKTGKLTPHDPAQNLSKLAGTAFEPGATCPKFLKFLDMIFEGDQDIISYTQRAFGYSMTGLADEKVLLFCHGKAGDNGKSTLFNAIAHVLEDYFHNAQAEVIMDIRRPAGGALEGLAAMKGARCVVLDELNGSSTLDSAGLKKMTGADRRVKARFLYGHEFDYAPSFTLWMFGNERPRANANDNATWNRVKTIPFEYSIPKNEQKPMEQVIATFQAEAPGILNWMLEGWHVYRDDKKSLNVDVPEKIQAATQLYRDESDTLKSFLEECFVNGYDLIQHCDPDTDELIGIYPNADTMLQDKSLREPRPKVWSAYKLWCQKYKERKLKQTDFFVYLTEHGFAIKSERARQYFVHGLKFLDTTQQAPHPASQQQHTTQPEPQPEPEPEPVQEEIGPDDWQVNTQLHLNG